MLTDTQCKKAICPSDKKLLRLSDAGGVILPKKPIQDAHTINQAISLIEEL